MDGKDVQSVMTIVDVLRSLLNSVDEPMLVEEDILRVSLLEWLECRGLSKFRMVDVGLQVEEESVVYVAGM